MIYKKSDLSFRITLAYTVMKLLYEAQNVTEINFIAKDQCFDLSFVKCLTLHVFLYLPVTCN